MQVHVPDISYTLNIMDGEAKLPPATLFDSHTAVAIPYNWGIDVWIAYTGGLNEKYIYWN